MRWIIKIGLATEGNEFAAIDHVGSECFDDQWEAYTFTKEYVARGFRVNVYEGMRHVGAFEGDAS